MGFFDRLKAARNPSNIALRARSRLPATTTSAYLRRGDDNLEVVGEASYQDALWAICGGTPGDRIRHQVVAVLIPEPENAYDSQAISVHIEGDLVGYLAREVAALYLPGLHKLMTRCGGYVALEGVVVGGGYYDDGPGRLGVWLAHNPADFGLTSTGSARRAGPVTRPSNMGTMRTGFSEAWRTDPEDDSYDLSWFDDLPVADTPAITKLRELLSIDPDPIDRHFQFSELESRLYHSRDLYDTALEEFDEACRRHDAEMETICKAFRAKWGKVPLLETYRQMAIRQQKQKDWDACLWWAERGLALYGNDAAREEAVEDLLKRRNRALSKLETQAPPPDRMPSSPNGQKAMPKESSLPGIQPLGIDAGIEVLSCTSCGTSFKRVRARGRKPLLCPDCRSKSGRR